MAVVQWNLSITVTLGTVLTGCSAEVDSACTTIALVNGHWDLPHGLACIIITTGGLSNLMAVSTHRFHCTLCICTNTYTGNSMSNHAKKNLTSPDFFCIPALGSYP